VVRLIERQRDALAPAAAADRGRGGQRALRGKKRDLGRKSPRWVADPVTLATDPEIDVFVELMGGEGDPAKARDLGCRWRRRNRWSPPTRPCWRVTASAWQRWPKRIRWR
jgi:hypothetical protein